MPTVPTPTQPNLPSRTTPSKKPPLNMTGSSTINPSQWLNFSLPPHSRAGVPGSGVPGVPRRSRRGEGWRGGALSRERYVHANFRFVLKPTEMLSYGAHFADPDISLHWPHILQVLVPTFSAFSVAQGYVSADPSSSRLNDDEMDVSVDEDASEEIGEEAAERRRRIEEERQGRMCPICLSKPIAGRMTKCGHIFCFPCILHYIQLSEVPRSAKCPICGDTVHEGMLKSVKYLNASTMLAASQGDDQDAESSVATEDRTEPGLDHDHDHDHGLGLLGDMDGFDEAKAVDAVDQGETPPQSKKGLRIHMRLITRPQMTTLALPSASTWPSDAIPPLTAPWYFLPDILSYSRFMLATPDHMLLELERELGELQAEWDLSRGDDLGRDFVRAAREKVERQIGKVKGELVTDLVTKSERDSREAWTEAVGGERREREKRRERESKAKERQERAQREKNQLDTGDVPNEFLAAQDGSFASYNPNISIPPNLPVEPNPMPTPSSRKSRRRGATPATPFEQIPPSPSYYFYQSALGANVFLHPLDIRILLAHFKSYSLFPPALSFTSSGFDPGTINDELRKRCKYLGHLPTGSEVIFVEAELEEIVGKEGLMAFEQPLRARREKRRARVKREDKAKSKWERTEREKMPIKQQTIPVTEDGDFMMALATSRADGGLWSNEPGLGTSPGHLQPGSVGSSTAHHSPGTSPSGIWGANANRTFASTLTSTTTAAPVSRRRDVESEGWQVDAAWEAFDEMAISGRGGAVQESDKGAEAAKTAGGGGGRKGGKKGAKKTLVLGGGGGRRA